MTAEIEKTITTPGGKELVYRTKITARQRNIVRSAMMRNVEIDSTAVQSSHPADAKVSPVKSVNLQLKEDLEQAMIKVGVVKYADQTEPERIIETLLDQDPEEYDFVADTVDKALQGTKFF